MEECSVCKERVSKIQNYESEIEKEKIRECQKALERESIAKGMQCTKEDELRLREMQRIQMQEKKYLEQEEENRERMWHSLLLNDVKRKEEEERIKKQRDQQEMLERRMAYDEQIASANRKRQELLREEREKENRRLDRMKKKMEQDHYDAIKRKKEQQLVNKQNFIEGHNTKLSRLKQEKMQERQLENNTIRIALEELQKERQRKIDEMHNLRKEKEICTTNVNHERKIACELEEESDKMTSEWKRMEENKLDEYLRRIETEKLMGKQRAAQDYKRYLDAKKNEIERERQERSERMQRVTRTALSELQRKLNKADEELRKQIEYRRSLSEQIKENQKFIESELKDIAHKESPFTKRAELFKDVMESRHKTSSTRTSTNPVHPFKRLIESQEAKTSPVQLPSIVKR
ncbi:golgin subfamily A member 6-like protein 22 [Galleria mellonella]|uniref:Golgin subfamily A member 6-like protein 22 n=1 Tax=Galleria mellonella TaxID=7137 RepID=A0ABM3N3C0_GALME|nr:golgin subfamily A member 6-like protein 22 [Galleria mellonella]